ncbi:ribosomal protein L11 [Pneumocystis carinii B80]|uniref:Large ribosomal subunit protein uL11m n=1 Tax=Pneumocystis carinii (strain B80) TaxID=1408658 RepID=A0A0W4ZJB8_PNEC8|nr:ribosomal protein L11 [Pneumocystis carinii B80]KTW28464.1 ribosomal protein L11 [Pneumocystis carinii B80]
MTSFAKKKNLLKLIIPSGGATPQPPVGPALGARGVKSIEFCKEFNEKTLHLIPGIPIPTVIAIHSDRSFTFEIKTPPTSWLLFKAANIDKGSSSPGKISVGTISLKHVYEIAKIKHKDENLQGISLENICKSVIASAKSVGIQVVP